MKQLKLSVLGLCLFSNLAVFGQNSAAAGSNKRDGEEVEFCHQHKKLNELLQNPAFAAQYAIDNQHQAQHQQELQNSAPTRGTVYKVPVVFHVLHNNGVENISRAQILEALFILNRDYRLQNADAANVHFDFNASNPNAVCEPSDVEIEFVLATKAPNGACFSGITRTQSSMSYDGSDGAAQVDAIVAGNDVYQGEWAGNRYLNIFVCGNIGGAAGYTYQPSGWIGADMRNGIWILHDYVGASGTSTTSHSRALTHEVGHWFNLAHTWGNDNNPGVACGSDYVNDTPETRGVTSCNLNENYCGSRANVENYMDYSYCSKMFTQGQVDRMRAAITSSTGGRNNIWTASNLSFTGADGNASLRRADFSVPKTAVCVGETITFSDLSYNAVSGWTWSFEGGSPATASVANPSVTYNTPGVYTVTLTATDGASSDQEQKVGYITVLPQAEGLPFFEGFEELSSLTGSRWIVNNLGNNNTWAVTNTAAHSGSKSAKLTSYGQPVDNVDELVSSAVDLSGVNATDGVTLSFRYAYRKVASTNDDYLKVFISNSCGDAWDQRKTMHGSTLSNLTSTTAWTPTSSDWGTVHMTNVTSAYWVSNFRFKFRFESDGGNNCYLDDINIYAGAPSNELITAGLEELQLNDAKVYPNPADDELNVRFTAQTAQTVEVAVVDLFGQVIRTYMIKANEGDNLVLINTEELASGMYMVRLSQGTAAHTMQFVVK